MSTRCGPFGACPSASVWQAWHDWALNRALPLAASPRAARVRRAAASDVRLPTLVRVLGVGLRHDNQEFLLHGRRRLGTARQPREGHAMAREFLPEEGGGVGIRVEDGAREDRP